MLPLRDAILTHRQMWATNLVILKRRRSFSFLICWRSISMEGYLRKGPDGSGRPWKFKSNFEWCGEKYMCKHARMNNLMRSGRTLINGCYHPSGFLSCLKVLAKLGEEEVGGVFFAKKYTGLKKYTTNISAGWGRGDIIKIGIFPILLLQRWKWPHQIHSTKMFQLCQI